MGRQEVEDIADFQPFFNTYRDNERHRQTMIVALQHRLNICRAWGLPAGAKLLDVGCGQGESTLVLASQVGPEGRITGVDTAPADYGGPYTTGQGQGHVLACSPLGSRIGFVRVEPCTFLAANQTQDQKLDGAVFCHSLWYFASSSLVLDLFRSLAASEVKTLYIAEWSGSASHPDQEAHRLAAEVQMQFHRCRAAVSTPRLLEQNVRGALLPDQLFKLAGTVGWQVVRRGAVLPPSDAKDGYWEACFAKSNFFRESILAEKLPKEVESDLLLRSEKVAEVTKTINETYGRIGSMDVVWAVLEMNF
ncbi:hypothetical protein BX600DRAFT_500668 [Xylariales sp. PMI_506]|nr:hypothetical protein BX600DRAFT_500668 [Xylariales sp. PMI_506]